MTANVSIFSLKLILSMTEGVRFMRFGKHATPQRGARVCVQPCDPRENYFLFLLSLAYMQGAVTEIVRSLPTKTLTFSGDALEDLQTKGWAPVPSEIRKRPLCQD